MKRLLAFGPLTTIFSILYFFLSLRIMAPGLTAGDAPELSAACHHLGSAHAPGYPLYVLLGHLFLWLPLGTPAFRLTFLSVVVQTAAFILLSILLNRYLKSSFTGAAIGRISTLTAFFLMIAPMSWSLVTGPEVYSLHLLATVFLLILLLEPTSKSLKIVAFAFGTAIAHHHLVFLILPAFIWAYRGFIRRPKILASSITLALLGLSLYLILPIRAVHHPDVNWGNPATFGQFWYHVTRSQYGGNIKAGNWLNGLADLGLYLKDLAVETWGVGLLFAIAGLWWGRRRLNLSLLIAFLTVLIGVPLLIHVPPVIENEHIIEAFFPPILVLLAPWMASGTVEALERLNRNVVKTALALLLALLVLARIPVALRASDNSRNLAPEDIGRNMLLCLPSNAVLYSEGDTATFPLVYLKLVMGLRPDAEVFDRTGGLMEDLYSILTAGRKGISLPFEELVRIELDHESRHPHPAVFYSEKETAPERFLEYSGLLFRTRDSGNGASRDVPRPDFPAWKYMRVPRIGVNHDYLSRESGSRYFVMKGEYLVGRDGPETRRTFSEACRIGFDNARLFLNVGVAQLNAVWLQDAEESFARSVVLAPNMALSWYDWGYAAERLGNFREAETRYLEALQQDPAYSDARNNLAYLYMKQQQVEKAVIQWEEILKCTPGYKRAYRDLGLVLIKAQPARGRDLLMRYLQLDPTPQEAEFITKILASGGD
jgi:tetratricopeptide (TPR) repeat protein